MTQFRQIQNKLNVNFNKVLAFFVIFYAVGITGMLVPYTFPLFVRLTPFALLLSTAALAIFHTDYSRKSLMIFGLIYLAGFFIEVVGVQTGLIFGSYIYGPGLGIKVFHTPLIIGVNWLLLVYVAVSLTNLLHAGTVVKVFLSAGILLAYDLILEQVAPKLKMWSWTDDKIPFQNYVAWYLIALIFTGIVKISGINMKNRLAALILMCQLVFFTVLLFTLN